MAQLYYVTQDLAGTWKWPNETGWYVVDEANKMFGPGAMQENAISIYELKTGNKFVAPSFRD